MLKKKKQKERKKGEIKKNSKYLCCHEKVSSMSSVHKNNMIFFLKSIRKKQNYVFIKESSTKVIY